MLDEAEVEVPSDEEEAEAGPDETYETEADLKPDVSPSKPKRKSRRKTLPATYEPDKRADSWLKVKKDYLEWAFRDHSPLNERRHIDSSFDDWQGDRPLLDFLEEKGVDAPFSCREGQCSACACVVLEGEVTMRNNEVLEDEDLADGIRLVCQAMPASEKLRISYNG